MSSKQDSDSDFEINYDSCAMSQRISYERMEKLVHAYQNFSKKIIEYTEETHNEAILSIILDLMKHVSKIFPEIEELVSEELSRGHSNQINSSYNKH